MDLGVNWLLGRLMIRACAAFWGEPGSVFDLRCNDFNHKLASRMTLEARFLLRALFWIRHPLQIYAQKKIRRSWERSLTRDDQAKDTCYIGAVRY